METLHNIGRKYGTDKAFPHNYLEVYDNRLSHLRDKKIHMLEIGISSGASLYMWEEYFTKGTVIGADIVDCHKKQIGHERIITVVVNQEDREDLKKKILMPYDVILDDGGHTMRQQMISFGFLFKSLNTRGIYILEDLITSFWPMYGGNPENKNTALSALKELKDTGKITSEFLLPEEKSYIEENFNTVDIYGAYGDESVSTLGITAIITKK